jgi:sulfur carrier protein
MEILVNDETKTVSENDSLYAIVLSQLGEKQNGVAVAVNNTVIPKAQWASTKLKSNDHILIIKATQGG